MNTKHIYQRTVIIWTLVCLQFMGCTRRVNPAYAAALQLVSNLPRMTDGYIEGAQAGTSLWAINQAVNSAPGTFVMLAESEQIAVFIAPAARDVAGNSYWFYGFIDTSTRSLVDLCAKLQCGNMTTAKTMSELQQMLEAHGFRMIDIKDIPMTVAVLRVALKLLQGAGTTITRLGSALSDFLVVPTYMLGINPLIPDFKMRELPET
jgi:hypothetical protein